MPTHNQSLAVLNKLGVTNAQLRNLSDTQFQLLLGQQLRQMVLMHLKEGSGPVSQAFRQEFYYVQEALAGVEPSYRTIDTYIQNRSQAVFGDHVMMAAMGEMLGVSLDVNFRKSGQLQDTESVYVAATNRPQFTIDNHNNAHFTFKGHASGQGNNCLFHSIARALRDDAMPALPPAPEHAAAAEVKQQASSDLSVSPVKALSEFSKDAYAAGANNDAEVVTTITELEKAAHQLNRLKVAVGIAAFEGSCDGKSLAVCQHALVDALKQLDESTQQEELGRLVAYSGKGREEVLAAFDYQHESVAASADAMVGTSRKLAQRQVEVSEEQQSVIPSRGVA
ncbi:MAG: hypothetical protein P1U63_00395 [Coxiellaceae bacterium]|nr:hypothetical protein [Coxiellaceae bacterium]